MQKFNAAFECDAFHGDVKRGANTGRTISDLARIGLGIGEEFFPILPGAIGLHHHPEKIAGQMDDIGEILHRVPGRAARHHREAEDGDGQLPDHIAIAALFLRHGRRGQGAAGTAAIVNNHLLSKIARSRFRQGAQLAIGGSAGRPGHDQANGAIGKA